MMLPAWHEEPISKKHDRNAFNCGDADLNDFLRRHARQSHDQGGAKTFLAIDDADSGILGFYSLAPASLDYARTPAIAKRRLARHDVPGFRLARLATHISVGGQGLGGQLIAGAARRCLRAAADVGGVIMIVDAKSERAAAWYTKYGAIPLDDAPLTLVFELALFEGSLRKGGHL